MPLGGIKIYAGLEKGGELIIELIKKSRREPPEIHGSGSILTQHPRSSIGGQTLDSSGVVTRNASNFFHQFEFFINRLRGNPAIDLSMI